MSEHKILYRNVEVPPEVMMGLFGGATLKAFQAGVDAALDQPTTVTEPDSEYDYYSDGDTDDNNEWIWRFPRGESRGEYTREYAHEWIEAHSDREDVATRYPQIPSLPAWARN